MHIHETFIKGVFTIEPKIWGDSRGYFYESFRQDELDETLGYKVNFVQDNQSFSSYGVMRGLHFQTGAMAQSKLVRCVQGCVLDVAVDIRIGSDTYGKFIAVELNSENHMQLFIPRGFAHGFAVLSETAIFTYKCDNYYSKEHDGGIYLLDTDLQINWQIPSNKQLLSEKDKTYPKLKDFVSPFTL